MIFRRAAISWSFCHAPEYEKIFAAQKAKRPRPASNGQKGGRPLTEQEYILRAEALKERLYRTAALYLGSESAAVDAVDEAVYKGFCACKKLRQPEFFDTWLTRILINECHREQKRQGRLVPIELAEELTAEHLDALPLKQALLRLPEDLKNVVILRFFAGYTQAETADILDIPQGTVGTRQQRALRLLRLELEVE